MTATFLCPQAARCGQVQLCVNTDDFSTLAERHYEVKADCINTENVHKNMTQALRDSKYERTRRT